MAQLTTESVAASTLLSKYRAIRSLTGSIAAPMSAEDQMVQSCPEASPMKWHQAHTTWFFETFILRPFLPDYKPFREDFRRIFNSYYNSLGDAIPDKASRSCLSRPSLDEVLAFRRHVDDAMETILADPGDGELERRIVLGLNHEQQHQELMLTDIKHALFSNPLRPAYCRTPLTREQGSESQRIPGMTFAVVWLRSAVHQTSPMPWISVLTTNHPAIRSTSTTSGSPAAA